jgi:hypothetical protein
MLYALLGVLVVGCWQAATVHFNYGGNWTALFCTGDRHPAPPELAAGTYTFKASNGYDGQFYRYVAHDPWFQKDWSAYYDVPALRCGRILVPGLAWILAGGQSRYIDTTYIAVVLLCVGLGICWLGRYVASQGRSPAWGLGFLLIPGTLISIDRLTVDIVLVALCAAWVWYIQSESPVRLYLILVLAGLTRETGLLLAGACCLHALRDRHWRKAAVYATAALPALVWRLVVAAHVTHVHIYHAGHYPWWFYTRPLVGIVARLFRPESYPFGPFLTHVIQALDVIALCGFLLAAGLAAWSLRKGRLDQRQWAVTGFLALMLGVSVGGFWRNVYSYGRPFSPLLLLAGLRAMTGSPWLLAPIILMDLRIAAQWAPQFWGILRGLLS